MKEVYAALAAAQGEFPEIKRTKSAHKNKYAPYEDIVDAVRPVLSKHGLMFTHVMEGGRLVTRLIHLETEQAIASDVEITTSSADAQQFGSVLTYMKRYLLTGLLGIATEEDDDGNRARGKPKEEAPPKKADEKDIAWIKDAVAKLAAAGVDTDTDKICLFYKVESIADLNEKNAKDCIKNLTKKAKAKGVEL